MTTLELNHQPINTQSNGNHLHQVCIWCGAGYFLEQFFCYADNEEQALDYIVVYLECQQNSSLLKDDCFRACLQNEMQHGLSEEEAIEKLEQVFYYVDATMDGAYQPHYLFLENLRIQRVMTA